jgi:pilus assembly protein CpaF
MTDLSKRLTDIRRQAALQPHPTLQPEVWKSGDATHPELYELRRRLHARVAQELGTVLYQQNLDSDRLSKLVMDHIARLLREEPTPMSAAERATLTDDLKADVLGHGPIEEFLQDPDVSEVMVNGPNEIHVERAGKLYKTNRRFVDENHLRGVIDAIVARVGRRIDEASPMVDARLPDGSRVNAIIHPLAINGPFLTIRKFSREPFTDVDLIQFGTLTASVTEFLQQCVSGKLNMVISGGTGAGKTSTLNVLSSYIPPDERIITVEDAVELRLNQPHVLQLESRPPNIEGKGQVTIRDLVRNALRMRPDRIVVGEVRGAEALDMLQAMNTGHEGSVSTLHANSPRDVLSRLETMVLMAGMDLPLRAIREQISSAIDIVVHQTRLKDGTRRITHVSEVEGMEADVITMQDIFLFDYSMGLDSHGRYLGHLKPTGIRPKFVNKLADVGIHLAPTMFMSDDLLSAHGHPRRV